MGGVIVGYEMGRQLGVPAIFFERVDGKLALRRGFTIEKGMRCVMVEDIVTTGLSSRECIAGIEEEGGVTVGAACLIDRSGGKADLGVPLAQSCPARYRRPMPRTRCRRISLQFLPSSPGSRDSNDRRDRQ